MDSHEINQILELIYIQYAAQKYLDSVKKPLNEEFTVRTEQHTTSLDKFISKGIDELDRVKLIPRLRKDDAELGSAFAQKNGFLIEELENKEWDEIFLDLL